MTKRTKQCGAMLLVALAIALCRAQEPVVVRLRDAVGDTIDLAERDSFNLFPNTAGFRRAVILALPGPEFYAEITRPSADSTAYIFLRIMPTDLERIRFLIDNHESVAGRQQSDSTYAHVLASFWHAIEDEPLRNMAGEPAIKPEPPPAPPQPIPQSEPVIAQGPPAAPTETAPPAEPAVAEEVPAPPAESVPASEPTEAPVASPAPPETAAAGGPPWPSVTSENRYNYTLHGITVGSIAGGFLGSMVSVGRATGYYEGYGYRYPYTYYTVNEPVLLAATCGVTALGSYAGYTYGNRLDQKSPARPLSGKGQGWRTCCAIGACVPGLTLGIATVALLGGTMYGATHSGDTERGASILRWMPAVLSGLCVTVEVVTLGYQMGRSIDQNNTH